MSKEEKPFTVSDRRHFTPEGKARQEDEAPPDSETPQTHTGEASVRSPGGAHGTPPRGSAATPPVTFSTFVMSLGAQASILLQSSQGAEAASNLDGASSMISILEMLRDKTEGRRTDEEDRILEGILYELRMGYLERTRAGGA